MDIKKLKKKAEHASREQKIAALAIVLGTFFTAGYFFGRKEK